MLLHRLSVSAFGQCLQASKLRGKAGLTVFSWRGPISTSTAQFSSSRPRLFSLPYFGPALPRPRHGVVAQAQIQRSFTSTFTRPGQKRDLSPAPADQHQQILPVAVPTYESSPAFYGIIGWNGYEPFISPGTHLPCKKLVKLESALDYVGQDTMQVCGFLPHTRQRVHLAELVVSGIRKARKEVTTIEAVMLLRPDLTGIFTARFTTQDEAGRAEASVAFAGGQIFNQGEDGNDIMAIEAGSFNVIEGSLPY